MTLIPSAGIVPREALSQLLTLFLSAEVGVRPGSESGAPVMEAAPQPLPVFSPSSGLLCS